MSRRPSLVASLLALAVVGAPAVDASAQTAGKALSTARDSVVAVRTDDGLATGFRFGPAGQIVTAAAAGPYRVTSGTGAGGEADEAATRDGVTVLRVDGLRLRALRQAERQVAAGRRVFVIGPPVGFGAKADAVRTARRGSQTILSGKLAANRTGAPVLDTAGRLVGMVGIKVRGGRHLLPVASLRRATTAAEAGDDGRPLWQFIAAGAVLLALLAAIGALVGRRRRRARPVSSPAVDPAIAETQVFAPEPPGVPVEAQSQPLVRRRETADEPDEDFDILFRSRGEER